MTEKATFAAGCFWGVEDVFMHLPGVLSTVVGYTGGTSLNPDYRQVCAGLTGHAEAVQVTFDPQKVSYRELLKTFWALHDPTTLNRQGPDIGSQYRSAVFFHTVEQQDAALNMIAELTTANVYPVKIVTQVVPVAVFYPAEEYHQQYNVKNGRSCRSH